jgi:hypothetical protein
VSTGYRPTTFPGFWEPVGGSAFSKKQGIEYPRFLQRALKAHKSFILRVFHSGEGPKNGGFDPIDLADDIHARLQFRAKSSKNTNPDPESAKCP